MTRWKATVETKNIKFLDCGFQKSQTAQQRTNVVLLHRVDPTFWEEFASFEIVRFVLKK